MTSRRLRPISRLISWVRPPIRPLTDSRSLRVLVARGSIAYSLVTQPRPEPLRQRGTPSVTLAATSTRVLAELDQHRPFGLAQPAAAEPHRAKLVMVAPVGPRRHAAHLSRPAPSFGTVRLAARCPSGPGTPGTATRRSAAEPRPAPGRGRTTAGCGSAPTAPTPARGARLGGLPAGQVQPGRVVRPLQ